MVTLAKHAHLKAKRREAPATEQGDSRRHLPKTRYELAFHALSLPNGIRFLLEVFKAVREAFGGTLGMR